MMSIGKIVKDIIDVSKRARDKFVVANEEISNKILIK